MIDDKLGLMRWPADDVTYLDLSPNLLDAQLAYCIEHPDTVVCIGDKIPYNFPTLERWLLASKARHINLTRRIAKLQWLYAASSTVRSLRVTSRQNSPLDIRNLPHLQLLEGVFDEKHVPLLQDHSNILSLWLTGYRTINGNLAELGNLPRLKYLRLQQSNVITLDALSAENLRSLRLFSLPNLISIGSANRLTGIDIEKCIRLKCTVELAGQARLRELRIANQKHLESVEHLPASIEKLVITDSRIKSLDISRLLMLRKLKYFFLSPWDERYQPTILALHKMRQGKIDYSGQDNHVCKSNFFAYD
jgi:Leucine-rich repeat (LRR) protein